MTIKEIAAIAGVSKSTVSRVLTGNPNVNKLTKSNIERIIEEQHYKPNRLASSLSSAKSKIIGIIVPDFRSTFYVEMIDALESHLQQNGYTMFLCNTRGNTSNLDYYFGLLSSVRVEGIFYLSPSTEKIDYSIVKGIPLVTIDGKIAKEFPAVICNHREGMKLALNTLIKNKCNRILYITGLDYFYSVVNKNKGYEQIQKTGSDYTIQKIETNLDAEENYKTIKSVIEKDNTIDGIACINDELAFITMRVLRELNKYVSKDVLLVGYDDSSYISSLAPELSSINIPINDMAKESVNLMIDQLNGKNVVTPKVFDLKLIKRSSLIKL